MNNELQALEYVWNTRGGATWARFEEDAEPIGHLLRQTLEAGRFVEMRGDGGDKLFLTEAGMERMHALQDAGMPGFKKS